VVEVARFGVQGSSVWHSSSMAFLPSPILVEIVRFGVAQETHQKHDSYLGFVSFRVFRGPRLLPRISS